MYHKREDFISAVVKIAQQSQIENNEDQSVRGVQTDDVPQLLQPDAGPGTENRGEVETFSSDMEELHEKNRVEGFLPNAFAQFGASAQQTGKALNEALDSFSADSITSKAPTDAAREKLEGEREKESSVRVEAFSDELGKILGR